MDTSNDHNSDSPSGETSYWVRRDNKIKGPRSRQRVITAINDRRLSPTDEISLTENGPWFPLEKWMNEDCNDEVLKTFEDEIEEFVSSESNQTANKWGVPVALFPFFIISQFANYIYDFQVENWYSANWSFWPLSILTLFLFCISRFSL